MCFGFRIISLVHLATLKIPFQNQEYLKNAKYTYGDTHFSKVKTACKTEDYNFTFVYFFLGHGHCNDFEILAIDNTLIGYFFPTRIEVFSPEHNLPER